MPLLTGWPRWDTRTTIHRRIVGELAAQPRVFDALRWILEAGFRGERAVLKQEDVLSAAQVLDLGCGTGALAGAFNQGQYLGIDANPRYIAWAWSRHVSHRFLVMDGRRLGLGQGVFDAVVIGGVVHHLGDKDAQAILSEARRVLKDSGFLLMWEDVPIRSPLNVIGKFVHRLDQGDHIRPSHHYLSMVESVFPEVRHYPMSSGVCDYIVMVARKQRP